MLYTLALTHGVAPGTGCNSQIQEDGSARARMWFREVTFIVISSATVIQFGCNLTVRNKQYVTLREAKETKGQCNGPLDLQAIRPYMNLTTLNNQALISLAPLNATTVLIGYYDYHLMTLFFICFISFQREKRARDYLRPHLQYNCTACGHRMAHRKWKETKQHPSMLPGPAVPECSFVSFHLM